MCWSRRPFITELSRYRSTASFAPGWHHKGPGTTLAGMDSVRFGRVLGIGARLAGRTLAAAVEAAVAPNPSEPREVGADAPPPRPPTGVVLPPVREAVRQVQEGRRKRQSWKQAFRRGGLGTGGAGVRGALARGNRSLLRVAGAFRVTRRVGLTGSLAQRARSGGGAPAPSAFSGNHGSIRILLRDELP